MRRYVAACLALLCCVALAGCTSETSATGGRTTMTPPATSEPTTSTTAPTTATTTAGDPQAPKMPPLAKKQSTAGAKAFVKYYVASLNYSWATGQGLPIRRLSAQSCIACSSLANTIDKFTAAGGFQRGADWHVRRIELVPTQSARLPIARSIIHVDSGRWRSSSSGRLHQIDPMRARDDFHLIWVRGEWRMTNVVPQ